MVYIDVFMWENVEQWYKAEWVALRKLHDLYYPGVPYDLPYDRAKVLFSWFEPQEWNEKYGYR